MQITSQLARNWEPLVAAGAFLLNVVIGFRTGKAMLFSGSVKRSDDPAQFWVAMTLSSVGFLALVYLAI